MIIGNQEIAVHLKTARNLTGLTSGRFMVRLGIYEINPIKKHAATPFSIIEKESGKTENRSQIDERYYTSKPFLLKAGINAELNQICIFRLNSPLVGGCEGVCNIKLVCQLIHIDYSKSRVVGTCALSATERSFHSYLEMNFYDGAPCQIVGTVHACFYKFEFFQESNNAIDMKTYALRYAKGRIDQITDYLNGQGSHSYEVISKLYEDLNGSAPDVSCIFPKKQNQEDFQKQIKSQKDVVKFEKQPLMMTNQKRQRKKLFSHPETMKTQGDEDFPETDPKIGERKRRKKIFHSVSLQIQDNINLQKIKVGQQVLHQNSQKIYQIWRKVIESLFKEQGKTYFQSIGQTFKKNILEKVGESVIRFKGSKDVDIYGNQQQMRTKLAYQLRNQDKTYFKEMKSSDQQVFSVLDDSFFTPERPIFFQQKFAAESGKNIEVPKDILIIMVHGLGACRLDMEKMKAQLRRYYDNRVKVFISTSNEARTEGNIDDMGVRLAAQVDYELTKYNDIPPICFLAHSMGGLIIRSALPRLQKYKSYFHAFVTLSSPHLGFLYSTSTLVDAGLWFINTMKKCTSIEQLTMQDSQDLKQTFLYKLTKQPGLAWFKRLVFLGSHQDLYVPYYSARVQKHEESVLDSRKQVHKGIIYCKMVENLLSSFKGEVIRVNVNFCNPQQNIDNLIGRAAHISFINSTEMIRTLVIAGPHYFF